MALGVVLGINHTITSPGDCELILSSYSGSMTKYQTMTFTVTTPSDGKVLVFSSDTNIAQASITDNTVTITSINYGSAIITVAQEAGTNYNTPENKTFLCIVENTNPGATLDTTEWEDISEISKEGIGDSYWDVGDTKSIILNGTIGTLTLSNFACKVFILHFNYSINGMAENNIIWGGFKDSNGKDIALTDSNYYDYINPSTNGTMYFNMNHWGNKNYGGWKGCDLRYDILGATSTQPSDYGNTHTTACIGYDATSATLTSPKANTLLAALSADFRNSLRLWSRWIDAVGNKSNVEENIKETVDAVTLLTELEVFGTRANANQYEQNHQSQMEYYRLGNSKVRKHHNDSSSIWWWLASPMDLEDVYLCAVNPNGVNADYDCDASRSCGVAPAFKT